MENQQIGTDSPLIRSSEIFLRVVDDGTSSWKVPLLFVSGMTVMQIHLKRLRLERIMDYFEKLGIFYTAYQIYAYSVYRNNVKILQYIIV